MAAGLLFAGILALFLQAGSIKAAEYKIPAKGTDGGCEWSIDKAGKLTIVVNGDYKGKTLKLDSGEKLRVPKWCDYNEGIKSVEVEKGSGELTSTKNMFFALYYAKEIYLGSLDTSKVTDMSAMFRGCQDISKLDVSKFNTSKVTDMGYMFYYTGVTVNSKLKKLDVSNFDTSNVTRMDSMFSDTVPLMKILDLRSFDMSKVETMVSFFPENGYTSDCKKILIDPEKWSNMSHLKKAGSDYPDPEYTYKKTGAIQKYLSAWISYNKKKTGKKPVLTSYFTPDTK